MKSLIICAALLMNLPNLGAAHEFKIDDLVISHPFAAETASGAMTGAGYFTIENTGDHLDKLLEVEANFPRVMMHETINDGDMSTMMHVDGIEIAPGAVVEFTPGGRHVMFMGLQGDPFESGEEIPAVLVFEHAGRLDVVFVVQPVDMKHE